MTDGPSAQKEMRDKLDQLFNEQALRRKDTMHTRGNAELELENQGRWAKPFAVTGTEAAAQYPSGPQWSHDPTGVEPPLGFSVNEPVVVGEAFEIERSLPTKASPTSNSDTPEKLTGAGAADPVAAGATLPPRTTGSNFKLRKF